MDKTALRQNKIFPVVILVFSALVMGLAFLFGPESSILISSVIAVFPLLLYLLFFRQDLFFPLLVFLVPISVSLTIGGATKADVPAEPLLGLMTIGALIFIFLKSSLNKKIFLHPLSILLILELCWMIFCSINSVDPLVSFKRCIVRFSFLTVFFFLFSQWIKDPLPAAKIFVLYAVGCIIPVIHGIIFHAQFNFAPVAAYLMPGPFFSEHTIYGACLAFLVPMLVILVFNAKEFGIRGWRLTLLSLLTLLIIAGEFLSFSRAAWVSLAIAFAFRLLIYLRIRVWMLIVLLSVAGFIVYQNSGIILETIKRNESVSNKGGISEHLMSVTNLQSDASNLERINRWKCAIRMAKEKPLTGFGPGTYQFEYGKFQSHADLTRISTFRGSNGHAHSEFFNAISETGIPGGVIYLVLMFLVIGYGLRVIYKSRQKQEKALALGALLGLITFYVHGFFNAFLDTDKMAVLVFGSIAIIVFLDVRQERSQQKTFEA